MIDKSMRTPDAIFALEDRIADQDYSAIRPYVADAIRHHIDDLYELERRKAFVMRFCDGDHDGVVCYAMLAVLTDDRAAWAEAVEYLGDDVPPSLGVIAHAYLASRDPVMADNWRFLIGLSRVRGQLEAVMIDGYARAARLGLFAPVARFLVRTRVSARAARIAVRDPRDDRLPFAWINRASRS